MKNAVLARIIWALPLLLALVSTPLFAEEEKNKIEFDKLHIYLAGDVGIYSSFLNGAAILTTSGMFQAAIYCALIIAVVWFGWRYAQNKNTTQFAMSFTILIVVYALGYQLKTSIWVHDERLIAQCKTDTNTSVGAYLINPPGTSELESAYVAHIDNVPFLLGVTLWAANNISWDVSKLIDSSFAETNPISSTSCGFGAAKRLMDRYLGNYYTINASIPICSKDSNESAAGCISEKAVPMDFVSDLDRYVGECVVINWFMRDAKNPIYLMRGLNRFGKPAHYRDIIDIDNIFPGENGSLMKSNQGEAVTCSDFWKNNIEPNIEAYEKALYGSAQRAFGTSDNVIATTLQTHGIVLGGNATSAIFADSSSVMANLGYAAVIKNRMDRMNIGSQVSGVQEAGIGGSIARSKAAIQASGAGQFSWALEMIPMMLHILMTVVIATYSLTLVAAIAQAPKLPMIMGSFIGGVFGLEFIKVGLSVAQVGVNYYASREGFDRLVSMTSGDLGVTGVNPLAIMHIPDYLTYSATMTGLYGMVGLGVAMAVPGMIMFGSVKMLTGLAGSIAQKYQGGEIEGTRESMGKLEANEAARLAMDAEAREKADRQLRLMGIKAPAGTGSVDYLKTILAGAEETSRAQLAAAAWQNEGGQNAFFRGSQRSMIQNYSSQMTVGNGEIEVEDITKSGSLVGSQTLGGWRGQARHVDAANAGHLGVVNDKGEPVTGLKAIEQTSAVNTGISLMQQTAAARGHVASGAIGADGSFLDKEKYGGTKGSASSGSFMQGLEYAARTQDNKAMAEGQIYGAMNSEQQVNAMNNFQHMFGKAMLEQLANAEQIRNQTYTDKNGKEVQLTSRGDKGQIQVSPDYLRAMQSDLSRQLRGQSMRGAMMGKGVEYNTYELDENGQIKLDGNNKPIIKDTQTLKGKEAFAMAGAAEDVAKSIQAAFSGQAIVDQYGANLMKSSSIFGANHIGDKVSWDSMGAHLKGQLQAHQELEKIAKEQGFKGSINEKGEKITPVQEMLAHIEKLKGTDPTTNKLTREVHEAEGLVAAITSAIKDGAKIITLNGESTPVTADKLQTMNATAQSDLKKAQESLIQHLESSGANPLAAKVAYSRKGFFNAKMKNLLGEENDSDLMAWEKQYRSESDELDKQNKEEQLGRDSDYVQKSKEAEDIKQKMKQIGLSRAMVRELSAEIVGEREWLLDTARNNGADDSVLNNIKKSMNSQQRNLYFGAKDENADPSNIDKYRELEAKRRPLESEANSRKAFLLSGDELAAVYRQLPDKNALEENIQTYNKARTEQESARVSISDMASLGYSSGQSMLGKGAGAAVNLSEDPNAYFRTGYSGEMANIQKFLTTIDTANERYGGGYVEWAKKQAELQTMSQVGTTKGEVAKMENEASLQNYLALALAMMPQERKKEAADELRAAGIIDDNGKVIAKNWLEGQAMLSSGTISGMHGMSVAGMTLSGSLSLSTQGARVSINGLNSAEFGQEVKTSYYKPDTESVAKHYEAASLGTNPIEMFRRGISNAADMAGVDQTTGTVMAGTAELATVAEIGGRIRNQGKLIDPASGKRIDLGTDVGADKWDKMTPEQRAKFKPVGGPVTQGLRALGSAFNSSEVKSPSGNQGNQPNNTAANVGATQPQNQKNNNVSQGTPPSNSSGGNNSANPQNTQTPRQTRPMPTNGTAFAGPPNSNTPRPVTPPPGGGALRGMGKYALPAAIIGTMMYSTNANASEGGGGSSLGASIASNAVMGGLLMMGRGGPMGALVGAVGGAIYGAYQHFTGGGESGQGQQNGGGQGQQNIGQQNITVANATLQANNSAAMNFAQNGAGSFSTPSGSVAFGSDSQGNLAVTQNGATVSTSIPARAMQEAMQTPEGAAMLAGTMSVYNGSGASVLATQLSSGFNNNGGQEAQKALDEATQRSAASLNQFHENLAKIRLSEFTGGGSMSAPLPLDGSFALASNGAGSTNIPFFNTNGAERVAEMTTIMKGMGAWEVNEGKLANIDPLTQYVTAENTLIAADEQAMAINDLTKTIRGDDAKGGRGGGIQIGSA
jgi:hypothetical protein